MTQIVESLFGVSPERYQQQKDAALQQEALAYAQLDPMQRAEAGIYAGARGLASGIGRMLGGEDPGMRRVTEQDQIIRSIDLNNPETYGPAAQRALQTGHSELAQKIMNRYSQLQESSALIGQRKAAAVASGAAAQQSAAQTSKIELSVEQETRLRNELNKLPANATEADIRGVLIKYGDPDKVIVALTSAAKSETDKAIRLEKIEADKIARQDKLEADRVALQDKLESRLTTEREKIEARKELEKNRQETQKLIEQNRLDAQAAQKEADRILREQLAKDRADSEERMAKDRNDAKNAQLDFQKQALQDRLDLQKQLAQDKIDAQVAAAKDRGATAKEMAAITQQGKVEIAKLMIQGKTDMATLAASLKGPSAVVLKAQDKAEKIAEGQAALGDTISTAQTLVKDLAKMGGMTSTSQGPLSNLITSLGTGTIGQTVGRMTGTSAQTKRDELKSIRLQLLNAVKEATGMSSQQLNSNVELKTYLDSLGGENMTQEANLAILNNISNRYLKKGAITSTSAGSTMSPRDQQALDWANANPNDARSAAIKKKLGM